MSLRPYQQEAVDAALGFLRRSTSPILIGAATGAGKSHIIAKIAYDLHAISQKRVLITAPNANLVEQNYAKFVATGSKASIYSASANQKSLRHPVVFGTPISINNKIDAFKGAAAIIMDEAHGMTPTIYSIINSLKEANSNLRIIGTTATPYRLGEGYIFNIWPDGRANGPDTARKPFFTHMVYDIHARELIRQGFLTPPVIGAINASKYDTSGLEMDNKGQYTAESVDRAYHGHGRLTADIVADIVANAQDKMGVMIFAATVRHAQEIMASLPPELSALFIGDTDKDDRKRIIRDFRPNGPIKYLVNVQCLTTGFDAPHVDMIALMRKTESVGLLQQIIGRGLRLHPNKKECTVYDYTSNLEDHCPDGDLFAPTVKASKGASDSEGILIECPQCVTKQIHKMHPERLYPYDKNGYAIDLNKNQILDDNANPIPVHFGRRCLGLVKNGAEYERCSYRWTFKECPHCLHDNDIAARYCTKCKGELVDPNEKLVQDFKKKKKDPHIKQTDKVLSITETEGISRNHNRTIRLDIKTPYRSFEVWLMPDSEFSKPRKKWDTYEQVRGNVQTVTYQKIGDFYELFAFNQPEDIEPDAPRAPLSAALNTTLRQKIQEYKDATAA